MNNSNWLTKLPLFCAKKIPLVQHLYYTLYFLCVIVMTLLFFVYHIWWLPLAAIISTRPCSLVGGPDNHFVRFLITPLNAWVPIVEKLTVGTKRPGNPNASGSSGVSAGAEIRLVDNFLFEWWRKKVLSCPSFSYIPQLMGWVRPSYLGRVYFTQGLSHSLPGDAPKKTGWENIKSSQENHEI